jgi:hypothetical protein
MLDAQFLRNGEHFENMILEPKKNIYLCNVGNGHSLLSLKLSAHLLPVIGDYVDSICSFQCDLQGFNIIKIGLDKSHISMIHQTQLRSIGGRPTVTTSTPRSTKALAAGLVTSLVMALIFHSSSIFGSFRRVLTTEPPWPPVPPKTTRTFFSAIAEEVLECHLILLACESGVGLNWGRNGK